MNTNHQPRSRYQGIFPRSLQLLALSAFLCLTTTIMNAQVKIQVRNCTEKIIHLKSYNSWDKSMTLPFPGKYGTATLTQIWGITADKPGEGETAEVRCAESDPFHWKKHNSCKVKFKCDDNTPCPETTKTLEAGNWVYFSYTDIQKGDKCYKIGSE